MTVVMQLPMTEGDHIDLRLLEAGLAQSLLIISEEQGWSRAVTQVIQTMMRDCTKLGAQLQALADNPSDGQVDTNQSMRLVRWLPALAAIVLVGNQLDKHFSNH